MEILYYLAVLVVLLKCIYTEDIVIDLSKATVIRTLGPRFIGFTLDSSVIQNRWETFKPNSSRVLTLSTALAPAYFRVGGTGADFLIFNNSLNIQPGNEDKNYTFTESDWDMLNDFVKSSGWELIFDLNIFLRSNGHWNATNALQLFNYSIEKGYKPAGFELGNELNVFPQFNVTAAQSVYDFGNLKHILSSLPELGAPLILGPDVNSLDGGSLTFMDLFLKLGGANIVDIITYHHYYVPGTKATVEAFHNISLLESLRPQLKAAVALARKYCPEKPIWLGETSSSYGRQVDSLSYMYVASFMWLDKLGMAAQLGIDAVIRQSFYGPDDGVITLQLDPSNDFWVTYLHKQLVGTTVLNISRGLNENIRIYAHCTNIPSTTDYTKGSVTLILMNLGPTDVNIIIQGVERSNSDIYMLSPGDDQGLQSKSLKLNGNLLKLTDSGELPPLPVQSTTGPITLPTNNIAFVVLPDALKSECMI
ncbi:hypothetical protein SNE40_017715 [Patella caerulea]|uniref:Uncharacterized protein n=1 Tax=Patella caerulea TaxID=87958 RepID=A0AAN8JFH2_PATCE